MDSAWKQKNIKLFRERKTVRKHVTLDKYFQSQILKQLKNTIIEKKRCLQYLKRKTCEKFLLTGIYKEWKWQKHNKSDNLFNNLNF